jgi:hypothetical protein
MQTLSTLNLIDNGIGYKGTEHLANLLHHNTVRLVYYLYIPWASVSFNADTHDIESSI